MSIIQKPIFSFLNGLTQNLTGLHLIAVQEQVKITGTFGIHFAICFLWKVHQEITCLNLHISQMFTEFVFMVELTFFPHPLQKMSRPKLLHVGPQEQNFVACIINFSLCLTKQNYYLIHVNYLGSLLEVGSSLGSPNLKRECQSYFLAHLTIKE